MNNGDVKWWVVSNIYYIKFFLMEICFFCFDFSGKYIFCCFEFKLYYYYMDIQKVCLSNFKSKINMVYINKKKLF